MKNKYLGYRNIDEILNLLMKKMKAMQAVYRGPWYITARTIEHMAQVEYYEEGE